jgi:hypothetical protein
LTTDSGHRRRRLLCGLAALAATVALGGAATPQSRTSVARYRYGWPVKPFDEPHPVVGVFGEPRTRFDGPPRLGSLFGRGRFSFHNGIDIAAPARTPVYAVATGIVQRPAAQVVTVDSAAGTTFAYWHISPVVESGTTVIAHRTVIGFIRAKPGHVHLKLVSNGVVTNPLGSGGIGPYVDRTKPTIGEVTFHRPGRSAELWPGRLSGRVEIVADVWDPPGGRVEPPRRAMPLVPAVVSWRVERWSWRSDRWERTLVVPETVAADFRTTLPRSSIWQVYARGTYQNAAAFSRYYDRLGPGRYLFKLTRRPLDVTALGADSYDVVVTAIDLGGNRSSLRQRFTVAAAR